MLSTYFLQKPDFHWILTGTLKWKGSNSNYAPKQVSGGQNLPELLKGRKKLTVAGEKRKKNPDYVKPDKS